MTTVQRGRPPIGYYTATVAKRKLGNISDGRLRYFVEKGQIERFVPAGMAQGFYKREDVDKLVKIIDEFYTEPGEPGPQFMTATKEDMSEIVDFLIEAFGGGNTIEKRIAWLQRNPEIAFIERSRHKDNRKGRIVGCVFVLPLTQEKIYRLFNDPTVSTRVIEAEDIQPYVPGNPAYIFILGMAVRSQTGLKVKRTRGSTVLRGLIRFLTNLGNRGIDIQLLAARSTTKDGINLLKRMGFTEITSTTGERNFIIEVERSGIPLLQTYKQAIAEWKIQHKEG